MSKSPIALTAFETLAKSYATRIDTKPHNAYYERPATLSLLPEVKGKRVLDVGCGPGVYVEWLVNHGAEVMGLDVSSKMVEFAKKRVGSKATIIQADLNQPLLFLHDSVFNIVLSALAMDYVEDWASVFKEFFRVLKQSGHLIISIGHPLGDYLVYKTENYFQTELIERVWVGFGDPVCVPSYRRPLNAVLNPLLEVGFKLERVLEPKPTEQFRQEDPEEYNELLRRPGFLCLRAMKQ